MSRPWIDAIEDTEAQRRASDLADSISSLVAKGDWKRVHELAHSLAGIAPSLEALQDYLVAAVGRRQLPDALKVMTECARIQPVQPPEFWDLMGCIHLDLDRKDAAIDSFLRTMPHLEKSPATNTSLALAYHGAGNAAQAAATLSMAQHFAPESQRILCLLNLISDADASVDCDKPLKYASPVTLFPFPVPSLAPRSLELKGSIHLMDSTVKLEVRLNDPPPSPNFLVEWRKLYVSCWADGGLHVQFGTILKSVGATLYTVSLRRPFRKVQRRKFKRIQVRSGVTGSLTSETAKTTTPLDLVDISAGGCQVLFPVKIETGDKMKMAFSFQLPGMVSSFTPVGIVRNVRTKGRQFILAIEFEMSGEDRDRLDGILKRFEFALRRF